MPRKSFSQVTFFTPEFADPDCLAEGGLAGLLRRHAERLFPRWLFKRWSGGGRRGRYGWPASVLLTTLLLASREKGLSRRGMVRRLKRDTSWRAACGLEIGGQTPDEKTFRRFERYMRHRDSQCGVPRMTLLHEHIVRLCLDSGVVGKKAAWAMDSTPMWCFGALHGTLRLLGDGLRGLCRKWARWTGRTPEELAQEWNLPLLLAKSSKGVFRIDWKDPEARADAIDEIVRSTLAVIDIIRGALDGVQPYQRKKALKCCRRLAKVISDDLETDEQGRLVVAKRVTSDRLVSITDPQARSSRKSKSHAYKGFKIHLLGELVSGLIASVSVTPANVGDGRVAHRLIRRARSLCVELSQVLGDRAYSGAELLYRTRALEGVDIVAPPTPVNVPAGRFTSADFDVDIHNGTATCPAGRSAHLREGPKTRYFSWKKAVCATCPLRTRCIGPRTAAKTLLLHTYHEEVTEIRARWNDPGIREQYRARSQGERLVNEITRRGCRHATAWGLRAAKQQVEFTVMACNLALLAKVLAQQERLAEAA